MHQYVCIKQNQKKKMGNGIEICIILSPHKNNITMAWIRPVGYVGTALDGDYQNEQDDQYDDKAAYTVA